MIGQLRILRGALSGGGVLLLVIALCVPCYAGWERGVVEPASPGGVTAVATGDTDNDGTTEIAVGGDGWGLRIYRGAKSDWEVEEIVGQLSLTDVVISDADNDGENEIVCSTTDRMVLLYQWSGQSWSVKTIERGARSAVLSMSCGDADNDGWNELVCGTEDGEVNIYKLVGATWVRATVDPNAGRIVTAVAIGDPDNDGQYEVVVGTSDKRLFLYERNQGVWERGVVDANVAPGVASIELGDYEGDDKERIIVGTSGRKIYGYAWDGESWTREIIDGNASGTVEGISILDVDGDGWYEIGAIAKTRRRSGSHVFLYEKGPLVWFREEVDSDASGEALALSAGDPDNDGKPELVVGTSNDAYLSVYDEFLIRRVWRASEQDDIAMVWESEPGATYYIYYSDMPYAGYLYATRVRAQAESVKWVDDGTAIPIHPSDVVARYYRIRKASPDVVSNTVGKFTRTFKTEMHLTSLPLIPYSNWIQDIIGTQLTGARGEGYADRVWKWHPQSGMYEFAWLVDGIGPEYDGRWWSTRPFGPSAMTLDFGDGFFVQSQNGVQDVTFVGALPTGVVRVKGIRPGLQMIGAACAEPTLLDSSDLYESGAHGAPSEITADRVWRWDEEELRYKCAWLVDLTGTENDGTWWDSENWGKAMTPMNPGQGYWYQARGDEFFWSFLH